MENKQAKILIVDDEETLRKLLSSSLERKGCQVMSVENGFRACSVLPTFEPDVIISDIKMPKLDGFQMWEKMKAECEKLPPVIFITGHGEKAAAIESLRKGAFDYLEKPFDMNEIFHSVERAFKNKKLKEENDRLTEELKDANDKLARKVEVRTELVRRIQSSRNRFDNSDLAILGTSESMIPIKETIERLSKSGLGAEMSVLISGPSGAGKEVVARLIHELSPRSKGPWVPVNCGAFPETLIESELFGHEKGAFTGANSRKAGVFELADGGTLFLDEIGELPLHMQAKLLRAIQERSFRRVGGTEEIRVNIRILAATNKDLKKCVTENTFREDLYYRLNSMVINIPALKNRDEDIVVLAEKFLVDTKGENDDGPTEFDTFAKDILKSYSWPGNVRELKSVVQRAAILTDAGKISGTTVSTALGNKLNAVSDVNESRLNNVTSINRSSQSNLLLPAPVRFELEGKSYHEWKRDFVSKIERDCLEELLNTFGGNVSALARKMQITRPNLCRLLKKHGIEAEKYRKQQAA